MASFAVKALDHIVLTCKHIPKTIDFYTTRLRMKHETFGHAGQQRYVLCKSGFHSTLRSPLTPLFPAAPNTKQPYPSRMSPTNLELYPSSHALTFGSQKINLHQSGAEFEPKAQNVQPGSGDLCFITEHPIEKVLSSWQAAGVE
ncbi:hypothetical protein KC360_g8228, partial [Hortaea werneckii]